MGVVLSALTTACVVGVATPRIRSRPPAANFWAMLELLPQPMMTPAKAITTSSTTSKTTLNARGIFLLSTTDECAILVRAPSRAQVPVSSLFSAYARRRWTTEADTVVVGTQYSAAMHPCAAPQPATGAPAP